MKKSSIINKLIYPRIELQFLINKLKKQNIKPILGYINTNITNPQYNYKNIKSIITEYPNNYISIKLSTINLYNPNVNLIKYFNICNLAQQNNCKLLIDDEYNSEYNINTITNVLQYEFNINQIVLYKSYHMYDTDSYNDLYNDLTKKRNFILGIHIIEDLYYETDYNTLYNNKNDSHNNCKNSVELFLHNYKRYDKLLCSTYDTNIINLIKENNNHNMEIVHLLKNNNIVISSDDYINSEYKYIPFIDN